MLFSPTPGWIFPKREWRPNYCAKEVPLPLPNQNSLRHCSPRSLSPGNGGTTGITVETLQCERKTTRWWSTQRRGNTQRICGSTRGNSHRDVRWICAENDIIHNSLNHNAEWWRVSCWGVSDQGLKVKLGVLQLCVALDVSQAASCSLCFATMAPTITPYFQPVW